MELARDQAMQLLQKHTKSASLIKHALSVESSMIWYAKHFGEDELLWSITGLLHDFDYEEYPDPSPEGHPFVGVQILRDLGYPEEMCVAILGHADYSGCPRESLLSKALYVCDELSGLVYASVLVRPDKDISELKLKSLKKKFKDKAFAKGVNRDDIRRGAEELEVELDVHMQNVIDGMCERKELLFDNT